MNNGITTSEDNETEAQRTLHNEKNMDDENCLFFIDQCMDLNIFENILVKK